MLLIVCYQIVRHAIQPLEQLDYEAQRIAEGRFDTDLTESPRQDSVGRLQNSFIRMQQSLATSVNDIRSVNAELEQLIEVHFLAVRNVQQDTGIAYRLLLPRTMDVHCTACQMVRVLRPATELIRIWRPESTIDDNRLLRPLWFSFLMEKWVTLTFLAQTFGGHFLQRYKERFLNLIHKQL